MCGRFSRKDDTPTLFERYGIAQEGELPVLAPSYNIAPGQEAAVVVGAEAPRLALMRWGLAPPWAKGGHAGQRPINARAETLAQKPMFRAAFAARRCLVPADGYYEWQKLGRGKAPWRFVLGDESTFSFAGLWESRPGPDGRELRSFAIITTQANELAREIHDRMPVILHRRDEARWLADEGPAALADLLRPYPSGEMRRYPVSAAVNSVANQGPELIKPLAQAPGQLGFDF